MRDPHRIEPFIKELEKLWKKHPDMRFGQLVINIMQMDSRYSQEKLDTLLFYIEDHHFVWLRQEFEEMIK
jgi:hypothetical protein